MKSKSTKSLWTNKITSRKKTQEAFLRNEAKFPSIFDLFEDIYYQTDLDGIITIVSPSVYRISGWKPEELIGQPSSLVFSTPADRKTLLKAISEKGFIKDFQLTLLKRDGSGATA
jgi:PAS domain S-box-containing protein